LPGERIKDARQKNVASRLKSNEFIIYPVGKLAFGKKPLEMFLITGDDNMENDLSKYFLSRTFVLGFYQTPFPRWDYLQIFQTIPREFQYEDYLISVPQIHPIEGFRSD
jgi:hypothetical protein